MKKRSVFAVAILALLLSLVVIVPAGAVDGGYGFDVDCDGAHGYGSVPGHTGVHHWVVAYSSVAYDWWVREGDVDSSSGDVPFNVNISWPESPGSFYYEVWLPTGMMSGHMDCPPPPPPPPPPCEEGCTPGYWKQPHHLDSWEATGYTPDDDFDTALGVDYFDPDITLLEALKLKGGKVNALARHAAAALLSAAHPGVGYPISVDEVKALTQAGDKDTLEMYNELGCPLN